MTPEPTLAIGTVGRPWPWKATTKFKKSLDTNLYKKYQGNSFVGDLIPAFFRGKVVSSILAPFF
jgi:hypothetical protein